MLSTLRLNLDDSAPRGAEEACAHDALTRSINRIAHHVETISFDLSSALEALEPGHHHGIRKHNEHTRRMVNDLPGLFLAYNLAPELSQLSRVVFAAHDLGRPIEAILRREGKSVETLHGVLSVEKLRSENVLVELDDRQRFLIEFAVRYHSERTVPGISEIEQTARLLLGDSRATEIATAAFDLTYFLRDRDKVDIFAKGPEYLSPQFILKEVRTWFFPRQEKLERDALFTADEINTTGFRAIALEALDNLVGSLPADAVPSSALSAHPRYLEIVSTLSRLMNGAIEPRVHEDFLAQRACDKALVGASWATYMLYAVAFVFDVRHDATLREIKDRALLEPWLGFVELKLGADECRQYARCVNEYLARRIGAHC